MDGDCYPAIEHPLMTPIYNSFDRALIRSAYIFLLASADLKRDQSSNQFGLSFLIVKRRDAANCAPLLTGGSSLNWIIRICKGEPFFLASSSVRLVFLSLD